METAAIVLARLERLPPDRLAELVTEGEAAGHRFLRRLVEDWEGGRNRFDRPDEAFFVARAGPRVVGVGGLNVDPHATEPGVGRVRRVYVLSAFRRQGVGRRLVQAVVAAARGRFRLLRLRTEDGAAASFYEALGFRACTAAPDCTHVLELE
jgi:GNAT superfamily N-acetyltransferase